MLKEKVISRKRKEERKKGREEGGRNEGREGGRKRRKDQTNIPETIS